MSKRFTIDGSPELESQLEGLCARVAGAVASIIPRPAIEAVVLGGGYGRGEGGVLRGELGDEPFNDLDFYVFLRGNRHWRQFQHGKTMRELENSLSGESPVHVELKMDSIAELRRGPPTMFSYDLVFGHRMIAGPENFFDGCEKRVPAAAIPLREATRLMFNRCAGLLVARQKLEGAFSSAEDMDFVTRNLAKMRLALGDAALAALGLYHWSARERHQRLARMESMESFPWLAEIQREHTAGLEFKLHPWRERKPAEEWAEEHRDLTELAGRLWLWLEGRRLNLTFASASDYALSRARKCPETEPWRNYVLNLCTFGPKAAWRAGSWRYPLEGLLNALALLLWDAEGAAEPRFLGAMQQWLHTGASDWRGLVNAFHRLWPSYA